MQLYGSPVRMGAGDSGGAGLYWLNQASRTDPGSDRPDYQAVVQPIRNGDAANLALDLHSLSPVPGSSINGSQDLVARKPGGSGDLPTVAVTNPQPGAVFEAPSPTVIEADVSAGTGSIARVEFFANWSEVGEDLSYPFECTWDEAPIGEYTLAVRAVRDDSIASTACVRIAVVSSAPVDEGGSAPRIVPNPFASCTSIEFSLPCDELVELVMYDCTGRRMETILRERYMTGTHVVRFDTGLIPPGLYFYQITTGTVVRSGKLVVLR